MFNPWRNVLHGNPPGNPHVAGPHEMAGRWLLVPRSAMKKGGNDAESSKIIQLLRGPGLTATEDVSTRVIPMVKGHRLWCCEWCLTWLKHWDYMDIYIYGLWLFFFGVRCRVIASSKKLFISIVRDSSADDTSPVGFLGRRISCKNKMKPMNPNAHT